MNTQVEEAFIGHLLSKARAAEGQYGNPGDARRDLAELRGILHGQPWDLYRAGKHIIPALDAAGVTPGHDGADFREQCFYQIAGLFALAYREVKHKPNISFGAALRSLRHPEKGSDSLDGRFLTLLNSSADQLFDHLRRLICLLQASGRSDLDWARLLVNIQYWNAEGRFVQKRWARDYYRADTTKGDTDSTDDTQIADEGE